MKLKLSLAIASNPRSWPILDGTIQPDGIELVPTVLHPSEMFWRQLRFAEFDVSEMSFSSLMMARANGDERWVGLPIFTTRKFFHAQILVRRDAGIDKPADLKGKRVGTPEYFTTMLVWMRGLLADEYGVKPSDLSWQLGAQEQPAKEPATIDPVAGVTIEAIPSGKTLAGMLADGEIDALFAARPPSCFVRGAANVARMFPDYRAIEQAYYHKTGIFPLMHAVGIRNALVEKHRWLPAALLKAYGAAKDRAVADLEKLSAFSVTLPWVEAEYRATQAVLGPDIWPYGIEANRKAIETLCRYLHEQGFTKRPMTADELFAV